MTIERVGIIGGTGLTQLDGPTLMTEHRIQTELGLPSGTITEGRWTGKEVLFLSRHGSPHTIAPHRVNYRANLLALESLGCQAIFSVNAVGAIHPDMGAGALVVPDQLIDLTWGRESSFFDGEFRPLEHIDFTSPFSSNIREALLKGANDCAVQVFDSGVVGVTQGPRLETAAEVDRLERMGCDLVGMTSMPEAVLARELGIPYASLCLVVNPAAGRSDYEITMEDIHRVLNSGMDQVRAVLSGALGRV